MTILVGIKCKDGIIIGSDSSATFGTGQISTIEQTTKKIEILQGKIIIAGTGQIGLGQRFCNLVNRGYNDKKFSGKDHIQMANEMAHLAIQDFAHTGANRGTYGALVAFQANHEIHLCEFAVADFQPEFKTTGIWYASMGSGQLIADPFLGLMRSVFWKEGMPSLQEGIFIATWTLQHAIDVNAGGVNGPIQLAVLTKEGARMLTEDELTEHQENVSGVISHLSSYKDKLSGKSTEPIPDAPKIDNQSKGPC
jgi:20S proteasome alpha/beta subunit